MTEISAIMMCTITWVFLCPRAPQYPQARRNETIADDYFGTKIADPYRWLEDPDSEETSEWVKQLNSVSQPFLHGIPGRDRIKHRLTDLWNFEKYGTPRREGDHYFYFYNSGLQNQDVLMIQKELDAGQPAPFLDPNSLDAAGTTALSGTGFSDDGKHMAYAFAINGSDWETIKVKTIPDGKDLPDTLDFVKNTNLGWTHDGKGFFYSRYPDQKSPATGKSAAKNEYHSLYYHKLGTQQSEDPLCVQFHDHPEYFVVGDVTEDGQYLVVYAFFGASGENLLFYYNLTTGEQITGNLSISPIFDFLGSTFSFVANDGPIFTILTNHEAPMFKLIQVDIRNPGKEKWKTLVPENPMAKLDWASVVAEDKLVLAYLQDVKNVLKVHSFSTGAKLFDLPLDIGTISGSSGKRKNSKFFYKFTSFTTPGTIFEVDFSDKNKTEPKIFRQSSLKDYDPNDFETKQVFYDSKDGTRVPMFLFSRKNITMNGQNPTLLYGYGGFNIAIQPTFSVYQLVWVQNFNGIYAVANIRGGSEYGEKWHEAGIKEKKENVFDDFIAAGEFLVRKNFTNPKLLAIEGGSNGGLLVAACVQKAPKLYGAAIAHVGVMDMLRYQKFTVGQAWVPEFGSSENKTEFEQIIRYSPLHNLKSPSADWEYPAMMLLTADHDDRVVPSHSLKYMAQLYHLVEKNPHQTNPLIIRIETQAGHGAGKPTSKKLDQATDVFSFLKRVLRLKWNDL